MRPILALPALLLPAILLTACGKPSSGSTAPARAEPVVHESELLKLTLTDDAQRRLGIATVRIGTGSDAAMRETSGEVVVPPTGGGGLPTGSASNLAQIATQQAAADGEVARAAAQARLSRIALTRAEELVRAEAGSVRARDEAAAALATANAALGAAQAQRHLLGPPVAAMNRQGVLWVRVPVFGSDVDAVRRAVPARVKALGDETDGRAARPVDAPPSANAMAGTVDLYYALPNGDRAFRVGQRVAVALPLAGRTEGLSLPSSAILRDIYGGEWVYQRTAPNSYLRQRVELASERDGKALLARGLKPGAEIVTTGAAELFGTEFGAAH
jgi:membrane fusion protein, multidrug efflux system